MESHTTSVHPEESLFSYLEPTLSRWPFKRWPALLDLLPGRGILTTAPSPQIAIVRGDITDATTELQIEAVVNAANPQLRPGSGICGAIYEAAGLDLVRAETDLYEHLQPTAAIATSGYQLTRWIIHTAAPVFTGVFGQDEELFGCYTSALSTAHALGVESVIMPLLGAGIYGWPVKRSAHAAAVAAVGFGLQPHHIYRSARPLQRIFLIGYKETDASELIAAVSGAFRQYGLTPQVSVEQS